MIILFALEIFYLPLSFKIVTFDPGFFKDELVQMLYLQTSYFFQFAVEHLPIGSRCSCIFICSRRWALCTKSLIKHSKERNNPDSVSQKLLGGPPKRLNSIDEALYSCIAPHNFQSNQLKTSFRWYVIETAQLFLTFCDSCSGPSASAWVYKMSAQFLKRQKSNRLLRVQ